MKVTRHAAAKGRRHPGNGQPPSTERTSPDIRATPIEVTDDATPPRAVQTHSMAHSARVLFASPAYAPSVGGVETCVRELSTRLRIAGVDVQVLTSDESGKLPAEEVVGVHSGNPNARVAP